MTALRHITIANDNRPEPLVEPVRAVPTVAMTATQAQPVGSRPQGGLIGLAVVYQLFATALAVLGLLQGLDPYAVAGLCALGALGGVCALTAMQPSGWLGFVTREALGTVAALTAALALIIAAPALLPEGVQDPILITALAFATFGALLALRLSLVISLGGIAMIVVAEPLSDMLTTTAIQCGAIYALCAIGAWRARSVWVGLTLLGLGLSALWIALTSTGLHPAQTFGTLAMAAIAMLTLAQSGRRTLGSLHGAGALAAFGLALTVQVILSNPSLADSVLQPGPPGSMLAALLVGIQGIVLGLNLLRWLHGRIGWLGVLLPQGLLAVTAILIIDPSLLERVTRVPAETDLTSLLSATIGTIILAAAGWALWRNWLADRPVRTGLFAMLIMVQLGLLWPVMTASPELALAVLAATSAALCAVRLSMPIEADPLVT